MSSSSSTPNWAQLPKQILRLIGEKTTSIAEYALLRSVCRSWRSLLPPKSKPPWLLLRYDNFGNEYDHLVFDLADRSIRKLSPPLPVAANHNNCCGSSHGWLILECWPEMSLLNPVSRATIELPSLIHHGKTLTHSFFRESPEKETLEGIAYRFIRRHRVQRHIHKAVLSASPSSSSSSSGDEDNSGDCIVMVILGVKQGVVFCKIGDNSWTVLACPPGFVPYDLTYQNRRFYVVNHYGRVAVFSPFSPLTEIVTHREVFNSLTHTWDYRCLVERRSGGELLMLTWWSHASELKVFRLDHAGRWTEAEHIGNNVVFLGGTNHCGMAFAVDDVHGWKGNHVCYVSDHGMMHRKDAPPGLCVYLLNLRTRTVAQMAQDLGAEEGISVSPALWVAPSPVHHVHRTS